MGRLVGNYIYKYMENIVYGSFKGGWLQLNLDMLKHVVFSYYFTNHFTKWLYFIWLLIHVNSSMRVWGEPSGNITEPRWIPSCVLLAPEMYQSNRLTAGVISSQVKTTHEEEKEGGNPSNFTSKPVRPRSHLVSFSTQTFNSSSIESFDPTNASFS